MANIYYRPAERHRTSITIDKSKFITTIAQTQTVDAARQFIATIRAEMSDANHHVYAFRVGYGNTVTEGMSDDGEPSGTSGPPSLAVLRGTDLGDITLVTTRYFGGIKLGTGGLVRAYTQSAQTALKTLPTELKEPRTQLGFDIAYTHYEPAKKLIQEYNGTIDDEIFAGDVSIIATLSNTVVKSFERDMVNLTSGQVDLLTLAIIDDD